MSSPPRERKRLVLAPRSAEGAKKAEVDRQSSSKAVRQHCDAGPTAELRRLVPIGKHTRSWRSLQ